ncbi:MAG: ARMT1-like domain-containing protein [Desulfobacula sp.]|uniref:damage-control phosphatase ARMT1 family protein n=1 Tax=Desulfobacula sp. TaxID=2593537 RepID=UPI0025BD9439|nr:ARMT1-like domain-containing protein [Desulfobacula sp.]MCD4719016.1 ARMT1-like domain-containing protein [Desulfobacula sp.]
MTNIAKNKKHIAGIAAVCHPCIIDQARSAARFAELGKDQTHRVINVVMANLKRSKTTPLLAQHIIRYVADTVIKERDESPDFDIYAEVKEQSNVLSLSYAERFQNKIDNSETPLETGLQIAAAGNIIDFGAKSHGSINLDKELESLDQIPFACYDIDPFKQALEKASMLLYICDNSGEIVFDMLLIKEIQREYPKLQIIAAVREKPIINDATLKDAGAVGLDRLVTTISSGSVYPGTILPETTQEFQKLFASADVILSKGQGNFETLLPLADKRLFFLLRIKCEHMAALSKVKKDNLVLLQGDKIERS